MEPPADRPTHHGILYGIGAYGLWGLIPLYFKAVHHVAPLEILAHRAVWSFVVIGVLLAASGRWPEFRGVWLRGKSIGPLTLSAVLIAVNWLTFIYAVSSGQVLQASLGYFLQPLVNVLLGVVFLGERLRKRQLASIALAAAGVLVLAIRVGTFPWISLLLAGSFALYGLLRKTMPAGGLIGLAVETLEMTPLALAYLVYVRHTGESCVHDARTLGLLSLSGVVTSVPLLLFVAAARRLRMATLGVLQYLTPTLQFSLAVVAFGEPFSSAQIASFALIWVAILVYTADSLHAFRQGRLEIVEPD